MDAKSGGEGCFGTAPGFCVEGLSVLRRAAPRIFSFHPFFPATFGGFFQSSLVGTVASTVEGTARPL